MSGVPSRGKRLLQDREALVELVGSNRQRGEADHVPVQAAGEKDEPALERRPDDRLRAIRRALGELEREHLAEARAPSRSS